MRSEFGERYFYFRVHYYIQACVPSSSLTSSVPSPIYPPPPSIHFLPIPLIVSSTSILSFRNMMQTPPRNDAPNPKPLPLNPTATNPFRHDTNPAKNASSPEKEQ